MINHIDEKTPRELFEIALAISEYKAICTFKHELDKVKEAVEDLESIRRRYEECFADDWYGV